MSLPSGYRLLPSILQTIAWFPTRLIFAFGNYEVRGKENLQGLSHAIFAANHASELDPILVTAALTPFNGFSPLFYVSAEVKNFDDPSFGWRRYIYSGSFFRAWGAYPIQPGLKDYAKSLKPHLELLKHKEQLLVFPEGGITKDGALREGKGGIGFLAAATDIPVVPVGLSGTYRFSFGKFFSKKQRLIVTFGTPLTVKDLQITDKENIEEHKHAAGIVMERIATLLQ